MRIRELRKPKSDSDLSAEEISRKIGVEFRETKRHRPEAERTDTKGPPAERRTGSGQRRSVEPVGDVKRPVEGGTAESYSKIVADLYRSKRCQVSGEEPSITKSADGNPGECRIQHDSSPIHAAADTVSAIGTEREDTIDIVRKECQTASQNRKKCLTAGDVEDIRKMYFEAGLSLTRIAIQLRVGRTTVSRVFEREGWSIRPQHHGPKPRPEDYDRIRRLYFEDGLTQGEVAKELGVSQRQVQRVFEAEKWTPRRRGGRLESRSRLGPPTEESSAEGHSRAVAHGYKRRGLQAGSEEARKTGSPDEEPRERRAHPHGPMPKTEDYGRIRRLYFEEGLSLDKVATELGVSRGQILKVFEAQGWTVRPRLGQPAHAPEDHEKIRKLYFDEKLSLSQVARQLGVSATTVGEVLKREGWPARPQRGRTKWDSETVRKRYFNEAAVQKDAEARHSRVQPQKKKVDRDEVYRLHFEEGLTHQAIAERLSASVRTIGRIFREEGWVPRGLQKTNERDERSRKRDDYQVARRQEIASIREAVFGSNCRLCGETSDRFSIHRKDGEKHVSSLFQSPARLRALNPEEWAYLDYDCHFAVHLMMNNLGYDWPRIEKLVGNLREQVAHPSEASSRTSQNGRRLEEKVKFADTSVQNTNDLRRTLFGCSCVICGKDENEVHLVIHKKDGEAHDPQMIRSKKHLLACGPVEWVVLCIPCHYVTHWAMRRFHVNWEQIRTAFMTES